MPTDLLDPARPIGHWAGAPVAGQTGVEAWRGQTRLLLYEVPAVPDFSASRFPDLASLSAAERVAAVGARQAEWWSALHGTSPRTAVALRYLGQPGAPGEEARVRLFVVARAWGPTAHEADATAASLDATLCSAFPAEYTLVPVEAPDDAARAALRLDWAAHIVEVLKPEQVTPTGHDPQRTGFSFYYAAQPFAGDGGNDAVGYCDALLRAARAGQRLVLDLALVPSTPLTPTERSHLDGWRGVAERWSREQRIPQPGGLYSQPGEIEIAADPAAAAAKVHAEQLLKTFGETRVRPFLYAFRVLAESPALAMPLAQTLAAAATAAGSAQHLVSVAASDPAFGKALRAAQYVYVTPAVCGPIWAHPEAPETLRRLHRMATLQEVGGVARLPIPGQLGAPGLPLDDGVARRSARTVAPDGLSLGRVVDGARTTAAHATLSPADLARHLFVVGQPGSGKTTLCFSLLHQLWTEASIPFLVLEPAKTEYRALREVPGLDDTLVFSVGAEHIVPFRFNPLEVPDGVPVAEHVSGVEACLRAAFDLSEGPLPMIVREALHGVYQDANISLYEVGGSGRMPPTLGDLHRRAIHLVASKGYGREVSDNLRGALDVRLGALLHGPKGRCFNTRRSIPVGTLFQQPVVLELDALNDDEKAFAMLAVLTLVREHAKATRRSGSPLAHVLLIEEAHTVAAEVVGGAPNDPRRVAARMVTRMLAEVRALGQGMIIADQLPTAVAPEVVKNTNVKVMNRLVSADDREVLGRAMALQPRQADLAAVLPVGQGFVSKDGWSVPRLVEQPNFKDDVGVGEPPTDAELRAGMAPRLRQPDLAAAYRPYAGCDAVCQGTVCTPAARERSERLAGTPSVAAALHKRPGRIGAAIRAAAAIESDVDRNHRSLQTRCLCVHLRLLADGLP